MDSQTLEAINVITEPNRWKIINLLLVDKLSNGELLEKTKLEKAFFYHRRVLVKNGLMIYKRETYLGTRITMNYCTQKGSKFVETIEKLKIR